MKLKVCGITNVEDAQRSIDAGADTLGFIFYDKSPRFISPEKAFEIASVLPSGICKVGVFVNKDVKCVRSVIEQVGLNMIQLHGGERVSAYSSVGLPIIQAVTATNIPLTGDYILVDSALGEKKALEQRLTSAHVDMSLIPQHKLVLSGGLSVENIQERIQSVRPWAIDVCKGVELRPGKKDLVELDKFIQLALQAFEN